VSYAQALAEDIRGNRKSQPLAEKIDAEVKPEFHNATDRIATGIEPIFMAAIETLIVAHSSRNHVVPVPADQSLGRQIRCQIGLQVSTRTYHASMVPVIAL
jgi:uncharacterized protein YdhG (YjbR/CyaY superfamily)